MLERAVSNGADFAKLFGITTISGPSLRAADFPYTLSEVAEKVTGKKNAYWAAVQLYINRILQEQGVDIEQSDNRYRSATRVGRSKNPIAHKYSDQLVDLLLKLHRGGGLRARSLVINRCRTHLGNFPASPFARSRVHISEIPVDPVQSPRASSRQSATHA
jgi:hypothetical protein